MRAVPCAVLALSLLLAGCADPGAVAESWEDRHPETPEPVPWLWHTQGCGRCSPEERMETTLLYHDGTVAWFRWGVGDGAAPTFDGVPDPLAARFTAAWTHLEPLHGPHAPRVEAAVLAGLGPEHAQRLRTEAEAALAHVEGPPPEAQCHDCAHDGLGALPGGPHGWLVRGGDAPGWADLRDVMEELRTGLAGH